MSRGHDPFTPELSTGGLPLSSLRNVMSVTTVRAFYSEDGISTNFSPRWNLLQPPCRLCPPQLRSKQPAPCNWAAGRDADGCAAEGGHERRGRAVLRPPLARCVGRTRIRGYPAAPLPPPRTAPRPNTRHAFTGYAAAACPAVSAAAWSAGLVFLPPPSPTRWERGGRGRGW